MITFCTRLSVATLAAHLLISVAPARSDDCSHFRSNIDSFGAMIAVQKGKDRFDKTIYEVASKRLYASQRTAIRLRRNFASPADIEAATAAKASIEASNAVAKKALRSFKASGKILNEILNATIKMGPIKTNSTVKNFDNIKKSASVAASQAEKTVNLAFISQAISQMVFHKVIYAAICR